MEQLNKQLLSNSKEVLGANKRLKGRYDKVAGLVWPLKQ